MIHDASRQAYNLLENLLHWSRAQTGRMEVNPSGFDLHEIIEENIRLLGGNASEKNISLISKIYQGTLVYGDANMISTVIRNLISNAIKYTKPTGKVTLKSRLKGDTMEIAITDTGVGIKKEDLSKLFRIDTNFTTSGTANEEGTGLGLSLCKEFIDINNGTIKVDSKPGKGTTFYVNLPKPK